MLSFRDLLKGFAPSEGGAANAPLHLLGRQGAILSLLARCRNHNLGRLGFETRVARPGCAPSNEPSSRRWPRTSATRPATGLSPYPNWCACSAGASGRSAKPYGPESRRGFSTGDRATACRRLAGSPRRGGGSEHRHLTPMLQPKHRHLTPKHRHLTPKHRHHVPPTLLVRGREDLQERGGVVLRRIARTRAPPLKENGPSDDRTRPTRIRESLHHAHPRHRSDARHESRRPAA